ncbi:MAG: TRAP transporter small permease [Aquisalinus sp.]|nr:TRAP transporter small permease [Aquisalinus sp.]
MAGYFQATGVLGIQVKVCHGADRTIIGNTNMPLAQRLANWLGGINKPLCLAGRNLAGLLLAAMTIIVMLQVVARYGFNNSPSWTEELSKTLMVWTAFLVAPWAYREGANVSISFFVEAIPQGIRTILQILLTLLVIWICGVFFLESLDFVLRGMQSSSPTLPVRVGVFYVIVPIAFACLILVGLENIAREITDMAATDKVHTGEGE